MNAQSRELLISRVVDGNMSAAHWRDLEQFAAGDPLIWREIVEYRRDQELFAEAVSIAVDCAEHVNAPVSRQPMMRHATPVVHGNPLHRFVTWGGWAAAALVLIGFAIRMNPNLGTQRIQSNPLSPVNTAGIAVSAEDLLGEYLEQGKQENTVVRELPYKQLVEARPDPSGYGYEVLYIRPILERRWVPNLYEFGAENELGQARFDQIEPINRGAY